ncbi:LOG family protein [Iamia sp. SCSIO 61187]|uniref:LOG family protein n=1 Tax=Iamia sp. SCSIO 61187 TaxID=2722752 RepID=UPI00351D55D7
MVVAVGFRYFFARKLVFVRYASAFVVLTGGFGDRRRAVRSTCAHPDREGSVVLVGSDHWRGMNDWLRDAFDSSGFTSIIDTDLLVVRDDPTRSPSSCIAATSAVRRWHRRPVRRSRRAGGEDAIANVASGPRCCRRDERAAVTVERRAPLDRGGVVLVRHGETACTVSGSAHQQHRHAPHRRRPAPSRAAGRLSGQAFAVVLASPRQRGRDVPHGGLRRSR